MRRWMIIIAVLGYFAPQPVSALTLANCEDFAALSKTMAETRDNGATEGDLLLMVRSFVGINLKSKDLLTSMVRNLYTENRYTPPDRVYTMYLESCRSKKAP